MSDFLEKNPNAKITTESEFERVLKFAGANENDIFYDLGCGNATTCIVASKIFKIKKVVGIEADLDNYLHAMTNIIENNLTDKIWLWNTFLENCNFEDATLIYYSVKPNLNHLLHLRKTIWSKCKILTPRLPLPSIKPTQMFRVDDEQFFLSEGPLREHTSSNADDWARSFPEKNFKNIEEFYKEFPNDKKWISEIFDKIY